MRRAFLHGFLGGPEVWTDIAGPDDVVIALPGHGAPRGSTTVSGATIEEAGVVHETWDANVEAVANAIQRCDVVVGYSLGARIALGLLATQRVPRAILISVNPGITEEEGRAQRLVTDAAWAHRFRTQALSVALDAWEAQMLFSTQARVDPSALERRRARRITLDSEQLARSLETMGLGMMPDYTSVVSAQTCTLVAGDEDTKFIGIASALPAPLVQIANAGHDPLLEQPDALAAMLASIA